VREPNAYTNPGHTDTDAHTYDTYTNTRDTDAYTNTCNADAYTNTYYTNTNANTCVTDANANGYGDTDTYTQSDTEAAPNTLPAADAAVRP
jgi:hypothetical protein